MKEIENIIIKRRCATLNIFFREMVCWKNNSEKLVEIQMDLEDIYIKRVVIDFNDVVWIDTMMLCQLCLYLERAVDNLKEVEIRLLDRDNLEHVRFVNFLMEAGFITFFGKMLSETVEDVRIYLNTYGKDKLNKGNFDSSEIILPYRILKEECEIEYIINESISMLSDRNLGENTISFRLRLFLQEVLGNVYEHAYDDGEVAYCGIFIRRKIRRPERGKKYRDYILESDLTGRVYFNKYRSFIFQNNLYRIKKFNDSRVDYIQVYVIDIGKGILSGIQCKDPKQELNMLAQIFTSGKRINRRKKNTQAGGLYMINNVLGLNADGLGIKSDYNLFPIECGRNDFSNIRRNGLYYKGYKQADKIKGFSIVGYLNIFGDVTKEYRKYFFSPQKDAILDVYKKHIYEANDNETLVVDYRFRKNDIFKIDKTIKNIIVLVGREMSKNKLVSFFDTILQDSDAEEIESIIVADFVDYEISKYYMIFSGMKVRARRIILISRSYSASVFLRKNESSNNTIGYNEYETRLYAQNYENQRTAFESIYGYIQWLIAYESGLFWRFLNMYQESSFQKIYIRGNIKWNYNNEKNMKTYLDFSQASFVRECKELFILQLFRIISIYGTKIYFVKGDRFTEDICELANAELGAKAEGTRINVGSAYVTGTSSLKQSIIQKEPDDTWFYFFKHADFEGNEDILTLLDWEVEDNTASQKVLEESVYERIEETPFIAKRGVDFFRKRQLDMDNSQMINMSAKRMYRYLQEVNSWSDKVCFWGHVDLVGPHDNIIFNTVEMYKKDRLESYTQPKVLETSYDFLLFNFYDALGRAKEMTLKESVENDFSSELVSSYATKEKILEFSKKYDDFFNSKESVLLYFTDYATTKIIGHFQEIFDKKVNYRIIPMALVNRERGAASLLLSPLLVEGLQLLLNEIRQKSQENVKVTIFSAMLISTRLIDELKHIMFRIGADDVTILSLIDRRRLPFGYSIKDQIKTFWKLDIPPLGNERNCAICDGIVNLQRLSRELGTENLYERIIEISKIWTCKKAYDSGLNVISGKTIALPLQINEIIYRQTEGYRSTNGVSITTDIGLVLYSIEDTAITQSLVFLEVCLKSELDDNTKILLLCAYLGLFRQVEISEKKQYELIKELYMHIREQKENTNYSALALITIASQKKKIISELKKLIQKDIEKQSNYKNLDALICGIFISWVNEKEIDRNIKYYFNGWGCPLVEKLYAIFSYTCRRCQNTHSGTLIRIYDKGGVFQYEDYREAYYRICYLREIYNEFPKDILSDSINDSEVLQKIKESIAEEERSLKKYLETNDELLVQNIMECNNIFIQNAEALNCMLFKTSTDNNLQNDLIKLQEKIISSQEDMEIRETLKNVVIEWPDLDANTEYWYFWTSDIINELSYLMLDFRYLKQKIQWVLPVTYDKCEVTGVVEAKFAEDFLEIHFKNGIAKNTSIDDIRKRKLIKYSRPTIVRIKELAKNMVGEEIFEFKLCEVDGTSVLDACLKIPYIYVKKRNRRN